MPAFDAGEGRGVEQALLAIVRRRGIELME